MPLVTRTDAATCRRIHTVSISIGIFRWVLDLVCRDPTVLPISAPSIVFRLRRVIHFETQGRPSSARLLPCVVNYVAIIIFFKRVYKPLAPATLTVRQLIRLAVTIFVVNGANVSIDADLFQSKIAISSDHR